MKSVTVFLDANVLFSAAWRERSGLLRLWRIKAVRLVTTAYVIQEAERNLEEEQQIVRLRRLLKNVEQVRDVVSGGPLEGISLPDKDVPVFLAARDNSADFLLTGDFILFGKYFGQTIQGVRIMTPGDFLKEYGAVA